MYFYEILQQILDEKHLTIPQAARACGLPDGTIRSILSRKSKSVTIEVAFKLSHGLGVSLERLNGSEEAPPPVLSEDASKKLEQLAELAGRLTEEEWKRVMDYAELLLAAGQNRKGGR